MTEYSKEDVETAINNLMSRHGNELPDPDNYPNIVRTMMLHELYTIEQERINTL